MKIRFTAWFFWLIISTVVILSRFWNLTNKPLHFDESINGWFALQVEQTGFYKYDPYNFHGPMYFYMLQFFDFFGGRNIFTLRALPSCFSALSVLIFAFSFLRSQIVNRAMLFFILLSPAFLFFGRSGIHEMPFVFFQLVFAVGILRWGEKQDNLSVNLLLVGLFGMMMLKETFVLTLSSFAVGFLFLGRKEIARQFSVSTFKNSWQPRSSILLVALLIFFVTFFSGFMRNPSGLTDFVRAFLPWMKTGVGESGHNKEFLYWLKVISEAEPLVFLGVIMAFVGLFMRDSALRLMSAFSLAQLLIYSLIPYKTVWCVLSLVWGFYFVLAMFLEKFWQRWTRLRWVYLVGIFLLLPLQLRSDYLSVYREPIAMTHPYVYVNSTYEFKNFYTLLNKIFAEQPALILETKQIGTKEQWPWPWFLYGQPQVHYDLCGRTQHPHALFYICDAEDKSIIESHLDEPYMKIVMPVRQAKAASLLYLRKNVFDGIYHGDYQVLTPAGDK